MKLATEAQRWSAARICAGLLALASCREGAPAESKDRAVTSAPPVLERVEVRVDAVAMDASEVEARILRPLEAGLLSTPRLRHLSAEARAGHGRLQLELELDATQLDAALVELAARVDELRTELPPSHDAPTLRTGAGTEALRWFLHSEAVDPLTMSRLHARLVARTEAIAGVKQVEGCAPRRRVIVELDPARLSAHGLDSATVAAAIERALVELPGFDDATKGIAALRSVPIAHAAGQQAGAGALRLGELAAIRYGFGDAECVAASAGGLVASAAVSVAGPEALAALRSMLDDAARELPPQVALRRFGPEDTLMALSLDASLERGLDEVAELIGGGFGSDRPNWLVEVGVEAEPCVGAGLRVHLSVPGPASANVALAESLRGVPGVVDVELLTGPPRRQLWISGPERETLVELAHALRDEYAGIDVHADEARSELRIHYEREALARLGASEATVARQVELARGAELGALFEDDGTVLPLFVQLAELDEATPAQLVGLKVDVAGTLLPLSAIASLELGKGPRRLCRRDGQPALLLSLPPDEGQLETIVASLASWLPPGYAWSPG